MLLAGIQALQSFLDPGFRRGDVGNRLSKDLLEPKAIKMSQKLRLGYSPCPNDTFIFFALATGRIETAPFHFEISIADVEILNQQARKRVPDVTKVSISAVPHLLDDYCLLRSGGAHGRGCGPLVVARENLTCKDLRDKSIATPGELTTAHLLLKMTGVHRGRSVAMPFDRIMKAVAEGEVDAGVIIHEGRFTYPGMGLHRVLDLGEWWEAATGLPLPLGGILIRRDLGIETARFVDQKIRESLRYARSHPEEAWPYVKTHAQEMAADVIERHIETFVNDFSVEVGEEGERAIRRLLEAGLKRQGLPFPQKPVFWNEMTE
jgi:1,4-dihydroxy-6-naphthoate synthase